MVTNLELHEALISWDQSKKDRTDIHHVKNNSRDEIKSKDDIFRQRVLIQCLSSPTMFATHSNLDCSSLIMHVESVNTLEMRRIYFMPVGCRWSDSNETCDISTTDHANHRRYASLLVTARIRQPRDVFVCNRICWRRCQGISNIAFPLLCTAS